MVLHKTMQHSSTCSFYSAKELSSVLLLRLHQLSGLKPAHSRCRLRYQLLSQIQKSRRNCFLFYLNNFHSQKINPETEPHGSLQGYTVRPRKGAGQCSIGVFSVWHAIMGFRRGDATGGFLRPLPQKLRDLRPE